MKNLWLKFEDDIFGEAEKVNAADNERLVGRVGVDDTSTVEKISENLKIVLDL